MIHPVSCAHYKTLQDPRALFENPLNFRAFVPTEFASREWKRCLGDLGKRFCTLPVVR